MEGQHGPELPGGGGHGIHGGVVDPGAGVPLLHENVVVRQPQLEEQGLEEGAVRGDRDVRGAVEGLGAQLNRGVTSVGRESEQLSATRLCATKNTILTELPGAEPPQPSSGCKSIMKIFGLLILGFSSLFK